MKRPTIIVSVIMIGVCATALTWQRNRITSLEQQVAGLRPRVTLPKAAVAAPSAGVRAENPRPVPSLTEIRALLPGPEAGAEGRSLFALMPLLVDKVIDCSSAELLQLIAGLGDPSTPNAQNEGFFKVLLLGMVGEADPLGALEFFDSHLQEFRGAEALRINLLEELAKRDARLALSKLDLAGLPPDIAGKGRVAVGIGLLRTDVATGLEMLFSGEGAGQQMKGGLLTAARDPEVRDILLREANALPPGRMRSGINEAVLGAAMLEGGGKAVEEVFGKMRGLEGQERTTLVTDLVEDVIAIDPVWAMDFVLAESGGTGRREALCKAVGSWARQDFNAAGKWLDGQPASADRDAMILSYALTVKEIDREAASVWINEISDPAMRGEALAKLLSEEPSKTLKVE